MSPNEKLISAQETLHTARALLLLSEEKAFALAEELPSHELGINAVGRAVELSGRLVLDALLLVDEAYAEFRKAHHDKRRA